MNKTLILVITEDMQIQNLITASLKTHDYRYLTGQNGKTALMEASTHNPDIVLIDSELKDMYSKDVIKKNQKLVQSADYCHGKFGRKRGAYHTS